MRRDAWMTLAMCMVGWMTMAQTAGPVRLANPSFEDEPGASKVPAHWANCGNESESPPDVQPGAFGVALPAADGQTCLGLVVRDNETWEAVGQQLATPLSPDTCYRLDLYLGRARELYSVSRSQHTRTNFITPVLLRVWGANTELCARGDILAVSEPVKWFGWHRQRLILQPVHEVRYLTLEAWYAPDFGRGVNGHLLVDGLSELTPVPCSERVAPAPQRRTPRPDTTTAAAPLPADSSVQALRRTIEAQVPLIAFGPDGILTADGKAAVQALAAALRTRPGYGLVLALDLPDAQTAARRRKTLQRAFKEAGLKKPQILVQPFRPQDAFAFSWIVRKGSIRARLRRVL